MSWAGVAVTVISAAYSASEGHKAKTSAKHVKERARGRENELADAADSASALSRRKGREDTAKRVSGYARNLNIFGGSPSSMADAARKTLTGQ